MTDDTNLTVNTNNRADRYWVPAIIAILLAAAVLRIGIVHYANAHPDRFMWPDSQRYLQVAANIVAGRGPIVSSADRTGVDPGYPLLLSWLTRVWDGNIEKIAAAARWLNVPIGLATVLFAAYLGRLLFSARAGLAGAAILAVQPIQVYFHALVLTEVLYTMLLVGSLYMLARYTMGSGGVSLFLAGIGLGLASLTRSSGLFLPVLLLPVVAWAGWRRVQTGRTSSALASLVTFCVCYACVLTPMTYRNYRILGTFVPVRTGAGASLLEGNGPWADGGPGMEKVQWPKYPPDANEYARDKINQKAAVEYIKQSPGRFVRLAAGKFLRTWNVRMNLAGYKNPLYDLLAMVSTIPVYVLLAIGWWRHRRQAIRWYLLVVPALYFSLLHMVFVGSVRYRYPAMPALMVLAGAALASGKQEQVADKPPLPAVAGA